MQLVYAILLLVLIAQRLDITAIGDEGLGYFFLASLGSFFHYLKWLSRCFLWHLPVHIFASFWLHVIRMNEKLRVLCQDLLIALRWNQVTVIRH